MLGSSWSANLSKTEDFIVKNQFGRKVRVNVHSFLDPRVEQWKCTVQFAGPYTLNLAVL